MKMKSVLVLSLFSHGITSAGAFVAGGPTAIRSATASIPPSASFVGITGSCLHGRKRVEEDASTDESSPACTENHHHKIGWRRRVMSRLRRNRGSLEATATAEETPRTSPDTVDQFILENFEKISPEQLFSTLEQTQYTIDSSPGRGPFYEAPVELPIVEEATTSSSASNATVDFASSFAFDHEEDEELLLDCVLPISLIGSTSSFEGGSQVRKVVRNWFQNLLTNCFCDWAAEEPANLQVRCSPTGNVLPQILRGELQCNARAEFDRLVFNFLRLSGGTIEGSRLGLNLLAFTVDRSKGLGSTPNQDEDNNSGQPTNTPRKTRRLLENKKMMPRYRNQFDLHAHDCTLTQDDLFESSCVRNGLRNLIRRILKRKHIQAKSVELTSISILEMTNKLSVKGVVEVFHGARVAFEVRTNIGFKNRGHVVTFPGLELSLSSPDMNMGFFVPISDVELDIGHNARIRECILDGDKKQVKLSASVTITPEHTQKLSRRYTQSSDAFSAKFSYDVGAWLTRIGRFSL